MRPKGKRQARPQAHDGKMQSTKIPLDRMASRAHWYYQSYKSYPGVLGRSSRTLESRDTPEELLMKPSAQWRARWPAVAGWVSVMVWSSVARAAAAGGGQPLPWEGPLNQVLASFTGPVAKALCIMAIVVLGFGFAFSEGGGLRRILGLLLGVSIAVTATSFGVTFFGFDGGATW